MSVIEKVHELNRGVDVLRSRQIRNPKVMVGFSGTGYYFMEVHQNGRENCKEFPTVALLESALDVRLASVRSVVALFAAKAEVA